MSDWTDPEHRWTIVICTNHDSDEVRNMLRHVVDYTADSFGYDDEHSFDIAAYGPDAAGGELIASYIHDAETEEP